MQLAPLWIGIDVMSKKVEENLNDMEKLRCTNARSGNILNVGIYGYTRESPFIIAKHIQILSKEYKLYKYFNEGYNYFREFNTRVTPQ